MYLFYTYLVGAMISIMVFFDGSLGNVFGIYIESAIVHAVGIVFSFTVLACTKKKLQLDPKQPKWIYFGGCIGVLTILFQTAAFKSASLTSIIALDLLGETLTSLLIDTYGLFDMKKHPFQKTNLYGLACCFLGIYFMFNKADATEIKGLILALCAGGSIAVSRCFNARLSQSIGPMQGSFVNHIMGFPICLILALCLQQANPNPQLSVLGAPWWMYLGGICGVLLVSSNNIIIPHVSQFQLTLLSFLGQMSCSFLLDTLMHVQINMSTILGATLIGFGVLLNMLLSKKTA